MSKTTLQKLQVWFTPERIRYVLYIGVLVLSFVPLLTPFGLPLAITKTSQAYYDKVQTLKPGNIVIFDWSMGTAQWGEMGPAAIAQLQQLFNLPGVRIIVFMREAEAPGLFDANILPEIDFKGKKYGDDWINLGYYPGGEVTVAALATNPHTLFLRDSYGRELSQYSLWSAYNSGADCTMVVVNQVGAPTLYMNQFQVKFRNPIVSAVNAANYPSAMIYFQSGQLSGLLNSLRGGAELESLIGRFGRGLSAMDSMSMLHIWIILAVIAGNISYVLRRRQKR